MQKGVTVRQGMCCIRFSPSIYDVNSRWELGLAYYSWNAFQCRLLTLVSRKSTVDYAQEAFWTPSLALLSSSTDAVIFLYSSTTCKQHWMKPNILHPRLMPVCFDCQASLWWSKEEYWSQYISGNPGTFCLFCCTHCRRSSHLCDIAVQLSDEQDISRQALWRSCFVIDVDLVYENPARPQCKEEVECLLQTTIAI